MKEAKDSVTISGLSIDAPLTANLIESYLRHLVESQKTNGILLGLSGGVDSSVLITLAVRAIGKEKVFGAFLFDRNSEKSSEKKARLMAQWLGIKLDTADISSAMKKKKVYAPLIMKLTAHSARFNRMVQHSYRFINGEVPFKTTLRIGSGAVEHSWLKRFIYQVTIKHLDRGFSERHIYRRQILEQKAHQKNLTLIGAANRSELEVGWFVKGGIDDLPIQPMTGLYKTQVWQLASYLELPHEIQTQLASPDMVFGISDEFGIGHSYRRLDFILDLIERKFTDEQITEAGVSKLELDDIRELMMFSAWKRTSVHETPPVQGGSSGNVRLANK